jgi:hypothetical protein
MESIRRLSGVWDRALAVVLTIAGAVALIIGWFGVSREALAALQIPYIVSGGLGGIFLMGLGAALWLSADLRDEWHKLDRIEDALERGLDRLGLGRDASGGATLRPLAPSPHPEDDRGLAKASATGGSRHPLRTSGSKPPARIVTSKR